MAALPTATELVAIVLVPIAIVLLPVDISLWPMASAPF
jgi:hypothetical protein